LINLKSMSTRFLVTNTVRRVITILGCLLFVFSFIYPFYYVSWTGIGGGTLTHYWSYEYDYHYHVGLGGSGSSHQWFFDYWFTPNLSVGARIPWTLVSLFTVQVLTLAFGVVFLFSNKRILSFEPIMFNIAVLVLMTYTGGILSGHVSAYSNQFQLGYYLVYPSVAMFVSAFAINEVVKKRHTPYPVEETI